MEFKGLHSSEELYKAKSLPLGPPSKKKDASVSKDYDTKKAADAAKKALKEEKKEAKKLQHRKTDPLNKAFFGNNTERTPTEEREILKSNFKHYDVELTLEDKTPLKGCHLFIPEYRKDESWGPMAPESGITYIYLSGSHGTWDKYGAPSIIPQLLVKGHRVLVVDYPGFGENRHLKIKPELMKQAAVAAYEYVHDTKGIDDDNIVALGMSLGSTLVSYLGSLFPINVIIDRGIVSTSEAAADTVRSETSTIGKFASEKVGKIASKVTHLTGKELSTVESLESFKGKNLWIIFGQSEQNDIEKFDGVLNRLKDREDGPEIKTVSFPSLDHLSTFDPALQREITFPNPNAETKEKQDEPSIEKKSGNDGEKYL